MGKAHAKWRREYNKRMSLKKLNLIWIIPLWLISVPFAVLGLFFMAFCGGLMGVADWVMENE